MATRPIKQSYKPRKPLGIKQHDFLVELLEQKCKLSNREDYVVRAVLVVKLYHENHQYHLNNLRKKYGHIMEK